MFSQGTGSIEAHRVRVYLHRFLAPDNEPRSRLLKIKHAIFLSAVVLSFLLNPGCTKTRVFTVGIVNINHGLEEVTNGFKAGMTESGFKEGLNIVYVDKGPLEIDRVDPALHELVAKHVDLILAITVPVAEKAAKTVKGTTIPVVFAPVFAPLEAGLLKSLTHPDGNLTGVQSGGSTEKALDLHKTAFPRTRRLLVPFPSRDASAEESLFDLKKAARKLHIDLAVIEIRSLSELRSALTEIPPSIDALWLLNSPFLVSHIRLFVNAAIRNKIPLSSGTSQYKAGVMLSYGQDPFRTGRQASRIAAAILNGTPPRDIPVETADFFLCVNLQTARAAGIEMPDDILKLADNIIR